MLRGLCLVLLLATGGEGFNGGLQAGRGALRFQSSNTSPALLDRTRVGTLSVPNIGLGTIAWSPDTKADEARFKSIAEAAMETGLNFFDTAERYGANPESLIPAAIASFGLPAPKSEYLGGDTETRLATWAFGGTVATKFAPTPWRGDAQSVVDACRGSAERLSVGRVALMQVHAHGKTLQDEAHLACGIADGTP